MSTNKLLQSLSEDPELEQQIGCMAGILQLFDRHQVLTRRRLYGHKRISAAAPKTPYPPSSNCGSPASESSRTSSETMLGIPLEYNQKQKHTIVAASSEQQKSQPLSTPSTPSDDKCSSVYAMTTPLPANDASPHVSTEDQLPKISFELARSSILTPLRLDSSRSLHEGRANVSHEGKVFARRSVDTAERAAAAARGALKELSRISTDFTGPSHHSDQVNIRDVVTSSFSKEQQVPKSTANPSILGTSGPMHMALASRMSKEASMNTPIPGFAKSRAQHLEAECNPAEKTMQYTSVSQAAGNSGALRPPRYCKPQSETPTKSCADVNESLRLLAKLREATPAYNALLGSNVQADYIGNKPQLAANHVMRPATSSLDVAKEGPIAFPSRAPVLRASDRIPGRMSSYESSSASSADALLHGGPKAREFPRLSLDGRGSSGAGFKVDHGKLQNARSLINSRSVSCSNSDCDTESLQEKRTSFSSNVVAKLMGLDEMTSAEPAEGAKLQNRLGSYGSLDQKDPRTSNMAMQEANPTFSQCGKYVSASFFLSKRHGDVKIAMDPEEEEEDSYLQMEPLSRQEARTLNVRVGSSNSQAGHRLATAESASRMGHPCYQPKNHHLMEDRPPHVLSPAARLCAQIEELQRSDSLYKDVDRGIRTTGMKQSSQHDLEELEQLLGAIHLNREYSHNAAENFKMRAASGKMQPERVQVLYPHERHAELPPPPSAVTWKTKQILNEELYAQTHYQNPNSRRVPLESHNRKVKNSIRDPESLRWSRQYASPEIYNQATHTRAETRSAPASTHPSSYSTPRKTNISIDSTNKANTATMAHRMASEKRMTPTSMPVRFSTSPQTSFSPQSRQSCYSSCSWEGSSVSSTSSGPVKDEHLLESSGFRAVDKKNKQVERIERKKAGSGILKDKEECKANRVSIKSSRNTPVEKKLNSSVEARSNARTMQRCTPPQSPDHVRSSMRSPTQSSARKAAEVKRKLNFVNHSPGRARPSRDQDVEFVKKSMVSGINNNNPLEHYAHVDQSNKNVSETGHDEGRISSPNSHGNHQANIPSCSIPMKTTDGIKSPLLLLRCADTETNRNGQQATTSIFRREHTTGDVDTPGTPICTSVGSLKLPQAPQPENEDTQSQGDKSMGSCEQPSPISVLEGPFYEEDISSPPTVLKLEEMEEDARGKGVSAEFQLARGAGAPEFTTPQRAHRPLDSLAADFNYVKQLLANMTCAPIDTNDKHSSMGVLKLSPLESHFFLQLEEDILSSHGSALACKSELTSLWRRRLLFDSVNETVQRRLQRWHLYRHQPWLLACEVSLQGIMGGDCSLALRQGITGLDEEKNVCLNRVGRRVLLEEVWEEIELIHGREKKMYAGDSMETSACVGGEEECDDVGRMLEEDLLCGPFHTRHPDTWASMYVEKGELALNLERLIFKDLIDHTICDIGLLILPTIKRQLFKLHN